MLPENHSAPESTVESQEETNIAAEPSLEELASLYKVHDICEIKDTSDTNNVPTTSFGDFVYTDTQEREAWEKKRDAYREKRLKELELLRVSSPELTQVIKDINFTGLKSLFEERLQRLEPADSKYLLANMPFATAERIIPVAQTTLHPSFANAHTDAMVITIKGPAEASPAEWQSSDKVESEELKNLNAMLYFHAIAHEETHIVSTDVPNEVYETGVLSAVKSGFESLHGFGESAKFPKILRRSFNEGVTEMITQELSQEYIRRYGFRNNSIDDIPTHAYRNERLFVEAMMEIISHDAGVPKEVVWGAINESYFTNRANAFSGDLRELFEKIGGDGFWARFLELSGDGYPAPFLPSVHDELKMLASSGILSEELLIKINECVAQLSTPPPLPQ